MNIVIIWYDMGIRIKLCMRTKQNEVFRNMCAMFKQKFVNQMCIELLNKAHVVLHG